VLVRTQLICLPKSIQYHAESRHQSLARGVGNEWCLVFVLIPLSWYIMFESALMAAA